MKQRITTEQLMELTPEQQERLRAWWKPEGGDNVLYVEKQRDQKVEHEAIIAGILPFSICAYPYGWVASKDCLPRLPIGQCIELLGIDKTFRMCQGPILAAVYSGKELIDALWEIVKMHLSKQAVKEVL